MVALRIFGKSNCRPTQADAFVIRSMFNKKKTWFTVILETELMLEYQLCWWHHLLLQFADVLDHIGIRQFIDDVQLHYEPHSPDHDPLKVASPSVSGTPAWILVQKNSSHRLRVVAKQTESAFIAGHHLLLHLTSPAAADVALCPLYSHAPLDISH